MSIQPSEDHSVVKDSNNSVNFNFKAHPVNVSWPHCSYEGMTEVKSKFTVEQFLICHLLWIIGCWLCWFIPFYMADLKDVNHFWHNWNTFIGKNNPK